MIRGLIKKYWRNERDEKKEQLDDDMAHPVRVEALIVEDNDDETLFLAGLLRQQNVISTCAHSIAGALECLGSAQRYQLAFVDLNLPNGSGIEVVRRIKENRRHCHVIVLSGAIEKIPLVVGYGYIGVLGKPYNASNIGEILWKHRLPCNSY